MQRREQQRRAASGMGSGGGNFLGGGATGYAPIPQRFEAPTPQRTVSPQPSSLRTPAFKSSGMKLGSKKTKQAELLDALGGELAVEEQSVPPSPLQDQEPVAPTKDYASSLPTVPQERRVSVPPFHKPFLILVLACIFPSRKQSR